MNDKTNKLSEKLKNANIEMREEIIYAEVFAEIKSGYRRDGLWAKALSIAPFGKKAIPEPFTT